MVNVPVTKMEHGGKGFRHKQASLEAFMPHLSKMALFFDLKFLYYLSNNLALFCKEKWLYLEIRAKANKASVLGEIKHQLTITLG